MPNPSHPFHILPGARPTALLRRSFPAAILLAALAVLAAALLPASCSAQVTPASAQTGAISPDVPAPVREAFTKARLHDLTNLRQRGPNFTAEGRTTGGLPARIVINGATGAILGLRIGEPAGPPAGPDQKTPRPAAAAIPH